MGSWGIHLAHGWLSKPTLTPLIHPPGCCRDLTQRSDHITCARVTLLDPVLPFYPYPWPLSYDIAGACPWIWTRPQDFMWSTEWGGSDDAAVLSPGPACLFLHSCASATATSKTCPGWPACPRRKVRLMEKSQTSSTRANQPSDDPRCVRQTHCYFKPLRFRVVYYEAKPGSSFLYLNPSTGPQ